VDDRWNTGVGRARLRLGLKGLAKARMHVIDGEVDEG
jgi:hypothetical protein